MQNIEETAKIINDISCLPLSPNETSRAEQTINFTKKKSKNFACLKFFSEIPKKQKMKFFCMVVYGMIITVVILLGLLNKL